MPSSHPSQHHRRRTQPSERSKPTIVLNKDQFKHLYLQAQAATAAAARGTTLRVDRGNAFHQHFAIARYRARGQHRLQYYTGKGEGAAQWWENLPDNAAPAPGLEEAKVILQEAIRRAAPSDVVLVISIQARVLSVHRVGVPARSNEEGEGTDHDA